MKRLLKHLPGILFLLALTVISAPSITTGRTTDDSINRSAKARPTPTPKKTVVSRGVLNGKAISKPQPPYPPIAKAAKASGTVTVRVLVDEEGNVVEAKAVRGRSLLRQAAVDAAYQAKFSPMTISGKRVRVSGVLTYDFVYEK